MAPRLGSVLRGPGLPWRSGRWPAGPPQRSCLSFSTCGRLQGVSASEMAYFSTVFKTGATNCTSQRGRQGPTLLYLVLHSQPDTRRPTARWESGLALGPAPGAGRGQPVPAVERAGRAVLRELKQGPGRRAAGRRVVWVRGNGWLWNHLRPSPWLCPGPHLVDHLTEASSRLCSSPWGVGGVSSRPDQPQDHTASLPQEPAPRCRALLSAVPLGPHLRKPPPALISHTNMHTEF